MKISTIRKKLSSTKYIKSMRGKRYKILNKDGDKIEFLRLDAKDSEKVYRISYESIQEIVEVFKGRKDEINVKSIKKYVPGKQSPAIAILMKIYLINRQDREIKK